MKRLIVLVIICLVVMASCKKESPTQCWKCSFFRSGTVQQPIIPPDEIICIKENELFPLFSDVNGIPLGAKCTKQ